MVSTDSTSSAILRRSPADRGRRAEWGYVGLKDQSSASTAVRGEVDGADWVYREAPHPVPGDESAVAARLEVHVNGGLCAVEAVFAGWGDASATDAMSLSLPDGTVMLAVRCPATTAHVEAGTVSAPSPPERARAQATTAGATVAVLRIELHGADATGAADVGFACHAADGEVVGEGRIRCRSPPDQQGR